jgi:uncharacterized protein (DUF1330 family)
MAAYVIGNVNVTDPATYEAYRKLVPATLEKYGGKFIVRGGPLEVIEGNWQPARLVVLEFESVEQAKRWYNSEEYSAAREFRFKAAETDLVIVEGI